MRIGHYAPHIWARGGIASYIRRLAQAQTAAGHTVCTLGMDVLEHPVGVCHLVVRDEAALFEQARRIGLDVLHLHKAVGTLPAYPLPTLRTMHGHQGSCPSATRYLARSQRPCDRAYSVGGCLLGHAVDRCGSRRPRNVKAAFESIRRERALASQMHTVTVSRFLKEQMVRAGCPAERLHVLPSPAPESPPYRPPPRHGVPHFVFLGRLVRQKGLGWLLHAQAAVPDPMHLDVAGDGPERGALEALACSLGLEDRVTFHGWVEAAEAWRLMQAARAVVVPSVWHEPAGLVTLEAAACGRAVVASRVGGIPEYAYPDAALLVDPHDVAGLVAALTHLASSRDLAEHLGQAGLARARETFALPPFVEALDALYCLAISDASTPDGGGSAWAAVPSRRASYGASARRRRAVPRGAMNEPKDLRTKT
ncbi:MAG: glycosyltransferase family 4 protein [Rhodothermaceae bacterium]|nr:glycosyltransferase family 4 protein [Rhodothermaceae bacterium]